MSLKKENKIVSIEISGEFNTICVKKVVIIKENNTNISSNNLRECYECMTPLDTLPQEVKEIAEVVWTDEIKVAYNDFLNAFAT